MNTPISTAVELGATTLYVLPTGLPVALQSVTNLLSQRLAYDIGDRRGAAELRVVPPPCPLSISAADFGHTAELIRRATETAEAWLAAGMPQGVEQVLQPHHHVGDGSVSPSAGRVLA
jgi:NTE family protein